MLLALQNNSFYRPFGRIFREQSSNEIIGGYVFHVIQELRGPASLLATRAIMNGGPVLKSGYEHYLDRIVDDVLNHPGLRGTYFEIWHGTDPSKSLDLLQKRGFVFSEHLNYLIDLRGGHEAVWEQIRRSRKRYIKRGLRDLDIHQVQSSQDLRVLCSMFRETYSRIDVPLIDYSVFEDVCNSGVDLFVIAERGCEAVGSVAILGSGKWLYGWYGGSSSRHRYSRANETLIWWVLDYGIQHGYAWFDFGGAGKPDEPYGPRDFKAQFGGTLVNYGRHKFVLSPTRNRILDLIIRFREYRQVLMSRWGLPKGSLKGHLTGLA